MSSTKANHLLALGVLDEGVLRRMMIEHVNKQDNTPAERVCGTAFYYDGSSKKVKDIMGHTSVKGKVRWTKRGSLSIKYFIAETGYSIIDG